MSIAFDRSTCRDFNETISREWLITNGLGGYAAGTVAGVLTRMQHGLLVASTQDTAQLLLAKIDEELVFDERKYYLGTNEYQDGTLNPAGFVHLENFRLEEGFPVFTYHLGGIDGIVLEKRIWMPRDNNTTYIQYRLLRTHDAGSTIGHTSWDGDSGDHSVRGSGRHWGNSQYPEAAQRILSLTLLPFSAYRRFDQPQYGNNDWHFQVQVHSNAQHRPSGEHDQAVDDERERLPLPMGVTGCTIRAWDGAAPYSIFAVGHPDSQVTFIPTGVWYWHFLRRHNQADGRPATDDLYLPGVIKAKLWPGEDSVLTIAASTEELSTLTLNPSQLDCSFSRSVAAQKQLVSSILQPQRYFGEGGETTHYPQILSMPPDSDSAIDSEEFLRLLIQAADRFLVRRVLPRGEQTNIRYLMIHTQETVPVILANYFSQEDSTRDALMALPGLTLTTGRFDEARSILRNYAHYFKQGLLPDRLPTAERPLEDADYGSVETTLWYFYALDHYVRATHDLHLLNELYQWLVESINWFIQGTFSAIMVDASDGLLRASGNVRPGKAVEVNALWYHALSLMHEWSQRQQKFGNSGYGHLPSFYQKQAALCKEHFQKRFWFDRGGYLYDLIDGPAGDDSSLCPNQLFALSLRYPVLVGEHCNAVFELVTQQLLTPLGLRTLSPQQLEACDEQEEKREEGEQAEQTKEQVSIQPWFIGPYIDTLFALEDARPATIRATREKRQQHDAWQKKLALLEPFRQEFSQGLLGMIGEYPAGNALEQRERILASAVSIAELLRVYHLFVHRQSSQPPELVRNGTVTSHRISSMRM
jgi:glycogen debranching enzyme